MTSAPLLSDPSRAPAARSGWLSDTPTSSAIGIHDPDVGALAVGHGESKAVSTGRPNRLRITRGGGGEGARCVPSHVHDVDSVRRLASRGEDQPRCRGMKLKAGDLAARLEAGGQLTHAGAVRPDEEEVVLSVTAGDERDGAAIEGPGRLHGVAEVLGEPALAAPVRVHEEEIELHVAAAREDDVPAIRRVASVEVALWVVGEPIKLLRPEVVAVEVTKRRPRRLEEDEAPVRRELRQPAQLGSGREHRHSIGGRLTERDLIHPLMCDHEQHTILLGVLGVGVGALGLGEEGSVFGAVRPHMP